MDLQQSKNASPLYRFAAGAVRGIELIWGLIDPSSEPVDAATELQVVFAGLGRTGTTSLQKAMEVLGYNCLHDDNSYAVTDLVDQHYIQGEISRDQMMKEFGERGFNCSFYYDQYDWAASQPNIKVILSDRDAEKWADSWLTVVDGYDLMHSAPFNWMKAIQTWNAVADAIFREIPTGGHPELYKNRDQLIRGYSVHKQNVINAVPSERLLIFSVKEGWEPLCKFLGVPVPKNVSFPHVNDRVKMGATLWVMRVMTFTWPLAVIFPLVFVWKLLRKITSKKQKIKQKIN